MIVLLGLGCFWVCWVRCVGFDLRCLDDSVRCWMFCCFCELCV